VVTGGTGTEVGRVGNYWYTSPGFDILFVQVEVFGSIAVYMCVYEQLMDIFLFYFFFFFFFFFVFNSFIVPCSATRDCPTLKSLRTVGASLSTGAVASQLPTLILEPSLSSGLL